MGTEFKKKNRVVLKLILAVIMTVVIMSGWQLSRGDSSNSTGASTADHSLKHTVRYEVEATGASDMPRSAEITVEMPTGTSQQSVSLPLRNKRTGLKGLTRRAFSGDFLYIAAQNKDGFGGVRCRIYVDGILISENSSSGGSAIATCKGSA